METHAKGRVLFVEPATPSTGTRSKNLARAGFASSLVSEESEALALVAKGAFDVLVVDLDMPSMNGRALIQRLRETGSTAAVVWLTSVPNNELAADATEAGVLQVLSKPTNAKVLTRVVTAAVDHTRHVLSTLREIVRPATRHRSVSATEAKNEFGSILDSAVRDGAVVISKHDSPKAVLVSIDRVNELLAWQEPDLLALTREFDVQAARMRGPQARRAARELFTADPQEFGEAAAAGVANRRG